MRQTSKPLAQDSITMVDRVQTLLLISPVGPPLLEFKAFTPRSRGTGTCTSDTGCFRRDVSCANTLLPP